MPLHDLSPPMTPTSIASTINSPTNSISPNPCPSDINLYPSDELFSTISPNFIPFDLWYQYLTDNYNFFLYEIEKLNKSYSTDIQQYTLYSGINMINSIFNNLVLYTTSCDIANIIVRNSIVYYIEFLSQISNEQYSFLKLTIRDSIYFAFKKSIYKIPESIVKRGISRELKEHSTLFNSIGSYHLNQINKSAEYFMENNWSEHALQIYKRSINNLFQILTPNFNKPISQIAFISDLIINSLHKNSVYRAKSQYSTTNSKGCELNILEKKEISALCDLSNYISKCSLSENDISKLNDIYKAVSQQIINSHNDKSHTFLIDTITTFTNFIQKNKK